MKRFKLGGEDIEPVPENIDMANVLMLLSQGIGPREHRQVLAELSPARVFECKACNRQFSSFQALGGHCANHKKSRLVANSQSSPEGSAAKPKLHECSICGVEFSIGQALGGHMRKHRAIIEGFPHDLVDKKSEGRRVLCFDLNLLPSED